MKKNQSLQPAARTLLRLRAILILLGLACRTHATPVIITPPQDQTNLAGSTFTYLVVATGAEPLTYQWRATNVLGRSMTNIPSATNDTLVLTNVQWPDRRVSVVVTEFGGLSVTSDPAWVAPQSFPGITRQPTNQTLEVGSTFTCSVMATGSSSFACQWYFSNAPLPGKTSTTLTLPNVQLTNQGDYFVAVSNWIGGVISQTSTLSVIWFPPSIPVQPTNQTLQAGETFTCRAVARGSPPLSCQWYFNNAPLANMTNQILTLTHVQWTNEGDYFLAVTNPWGASNSQVAHLTVEGMSFTRITNGEIATDLGSGGSACAADYDGDGYFDLFVVRYNNGLCKLYHNNGNGTFTSVTNNVFPLWAGPWDACAWADFDNDGRPDLYVLLDGQPSNFFYNNGNGSFTRVQFDTFSGNNPSVADYDHDGLLDFYMTPWKSGSTQLYRNLGGRAFRSMTSAEVGPIVGLGMGYSNWADYNDDGWPDLHMPDIWNGRNRLFRNDGTGRFVPVTNQVTLTPTYQPLVSGWGDYDNCGRLDVCVVSLGGTSPIYRNLGNGDFQLASVGVTIQGSYNSATWADYDNDGFLDLYMTYGNNTGNSLFKNLGNGTFRAITNLNIVTDRAPAPGGSYASIWFDYDNDGFLDLYVANGDSQTVGLSALPNFLYHNDGNGNGWLKVKLVGTASNRDAVGARVRVKATYAGQSRWQRRDITAGEQYAGNNVIAHFGLGDATNVETLRVEWPSGQVTETNNLAVRQFLTLREPPALKTLGKSGDTFQVQLTAYPGQSWDLYGATHLHAEGETCPDPDGCWKPVCCGTNVTRANTVTDPGCAGIPQKFYKAITR